MEPEALRADLFALAEERLAMWLLGDILPTRNFLECEEQVFDRMSRLTSIGQRGSAEVHRLVELVVETHAGISTNVATKKEGIASVAEPVLAEILTRQGYRCAVCGVPVAARASSQCRRFPDGVEPVLDCDLDHTVPYYLGGNISNVRVLCKHCNQLKSDRIGHQEDAMVINGNHLRPTSRNATRRRVIFWSLELCEGCHHDGCTFTARDTLLWVRRTKADGPWVLGNLLVECSHHAGAGAQWIHGDHV